jgi:flagellar basal-body rod modification protein FlgD
MALTAAQIAQQNSVKIVDRSQTGFNGLTSEDFLKILIVQLQNQDPANPMDSDQLLNQVSQMRALQSNIELSDALKSLTLNQQLTSAASFLGKQVTAVDGNNQNFTGTVDRVLVKGGKTLLGIGNNEVELSKIVTVKGT